MRLLPKTEDFVLYFEQAAKNILEGSELLHCLVTQHEGGAELARRIKGLEHCTDEITHDTINKLNATFITPFDREDIHALASGLDDVMDSVDMAAARIVLYELRTPLPELEQTSALLQKAARSLADALTKLRNLKRADEILAEVIEINRIENEGDALHRAAIVRLFKNAKDPIEVIKLKEVYEMVENALDRCEDVGNTIEAVLVKNA